MIVYIGFIFRAGRQVWFTPQILFNRRRRDNVYWHRWSLSTCLWKALVLTNLVTVYEYYDCKSSTESDKHDILPVNPYWAKSDISSSIYPDLSTVPANTDHARWSKFWRAALIKYRTSIQIDWNRSTLIEYMHYAQREGISCVQFWSLLWTTEYSAVSIGELTERRPSSLTSHTNFQ